MVSKTPLITIVTSIFLLFVTSLSGCSQPKSNKLLSVSHLKQDGPEQQELFKDTFQGVGNS